MKGFLKSILINFFTLFTVAKTTSAISFSDDYFVLFLASGLLWVLNTLLKPLLNLALMPINLITLGAFRWIINIIVLLLVTFIVKGFQISCFAFPGLSFSGFVIPPFTLPFFWSLLLLSFLIEITSSGLKWLFD